MNKCEDTVKTKNFHDDFKSILNKVKNRDSFAFGKHCDGEYNIMRNIEFTSVDKEGVFIPTEYVETRKHLLKALQYAHKDYFVGVSCPCCHHVDACMWMREQVQSPNITWANLFVNSNYPHFLKDMLKEFDAWEGRTVLLANKEGEGKPLPFNVDVYVPCNWKASLPPYLDKHITEMTSLAAQEDGQLFLFSAGPLGSILAHKLHQTNPNNTYLDIGSTVSPWLVGANRRYLFSPPDKLKTCVW
mgnify:FL=1|tara:strand:- start:1555 stop:2286 length:732 start_codon:yes stop_codon:yes gene_type:complete